MRRTYQEAPVIGRPSVSRVVFALANFVAAMAITVALAVQITDFVLNDSFIPNRYFAYFTIQTSLANIALLVICGLWGLQTLRDNPTLAGIRAHFVSYAIITGAVYNTLLRDLPVAEGAWTSSVTWPNDVTHIWIPLYFVLDWILNPHRQKLPRWTLIVGLAFPGTWFAFTLIRGELTGWYPYSFLNPGADAGWAGVGVYATAIGVMIIVLLGATILINSIHQRLRPQRILVE
jgi:hypothetical protein